MPIIREGKIVTQDQWKLVGEDQPIATNSIVPMERWLAEKPAQAAVLLEPSDKPELLKPHLSKIPLVVLRFDTFKDGRAFSQAAVLRSQCGYKGEIRAIGHILKDQLLFLHRCGVSSVEADDRITPKDWEQALKEFSHFYQPAVKAP